MDRKVHFYFNIHRPVSFAGPNKIYSYLKREGNYEVGTHAIRLWLQDIDAYSLQLRYNLKTRTTITLGVDALWYVDLADVSNLAKAKDGMRHLFIAIDVFSRYLWCPEE